MLLNPIRGPKPKLWRGYRNCERCTRWRPVSDFTVYKTRTGYEQIKGECIECKRQREKERYDKLTDEQKRAKGKKANKQAERRRNKSLHEIEKLRDEIAKQDRKLEKQHEKIRSLRAEIPRGHWAGSGLDIVPFRMWLLRQYRIHDYNVTNLAFDLNQNERQVRRWLDGYDWNGRRGVPAPVRSITKEKIIDVGDAIGEPRLLEELYPGEDQ